MGRHRADGARPAGHLTPRQVAVWGFLAAGRTDRQIADALCISDRTVRLHCTALYEALGVGGGNQRVQAAVRWVREGREEGGIPCH